MTVWDSDSLADRAIPSPAFRVLLHGDLPADRAPTAIVPVANRDEFPALPYSQVPRWIRFMSPPSDIDAQDNDAQDPGALFILSPDPLPPPLESPSSVTSVDPQSPLESPVSVSGALDTAPPPTPPGQGSKYIPPRAHVLQRIASYEAELLRRGSYPRFPVRPIGGKRPYPHPSPLPVARPTSSRPRPVGALWLRPSRHPVPLSPPQPARTVTSPSTTPTSPPPVPPRIMSPQARPSTSLRRPSTSLLSPHPRPAPDMPLTHMTVTSPGPSSLPCKTGGSSWPRPSTSPFSIAQSCLSPIAHTPPRPGAYTSTPQPCPLPPPTPDPVPPSNPLPESSPRRRKRRNRGLVGTATPRLAHGTVRGSWSKSQLVKALSSLCDTPSQLKFTRLPGCGAHSQLRFPWKGNTVLVNTWHTGRVHLQGFGACDLARQLSEMSPSTSRVRTRSSSPGSTGDSSGDGNNPSWVGRNLCLTLFMWIIHLGIFAGLRLSGGLRLLSCFLPRRVFRRKKIRGAGSQAASRRGARPRKAVLALKARARQHSAILSTVLDFSRVCIPTAPWLLVYSRSKHLASMFFLCCLFYFVFGLQGHGESPVVNGSMFAYESGLGVGPLINQEGSIAWIAPAAVLTPIGQTVAQSVLWGISISARYLACVVVLVSVLAIAAHLRSRALSVVPAPGVRTSFGSFFLSVVPASGTLDVPAGLSVVHDRPLNQRVLPSCDFCKLHKHFSVRRIGTVTLLAILACSVTPVLWQIGLDGVRVGEASHPGPAHPAPEGAPITLNVSEVLTQVSGSDPRLPAAHSGASVPGSTSSQAPHPYAAPPPPHPVLPSRPSRFCTPPLPRDSSRHLSGSPAPVAVAVALLFAPLLLFLRIRLWILAALEFSARSRHARTMHTPPMGGFPFNRCGLTSRHISLDSFWATSLLSGFGAKVSARVRSVIAFSVCVTMVDAPRAFTLWSLRAIVPLPLLAPLWRGPPAFGMFSSAVLEFGRRSQMSARDAWSLAASSSRWLTLSRIGTSGLGQTF